MSKQGCVGMSKSRDPGDYSVAEIHVLDSMKGVDREGFVIRVEGIDGFGVVFESFGCVEGWTDMDMSELDARICALDWADGLMERPPMTFRSSVWLSLSQSPGICIPE